MPLASVILYSIFDFGVTQLHCKCHCFLSSAPPLSLSHTRLRLSEISVSVAILKIDDSYFRVSSMSLTPSLILSLAFSPHLSHSPLLFPLFRRSASLTVVKLVHLSLLRSCPGSLEPTDGSLAIAVVSGMNHCLCQCVCVCIDIKLIISFPIHWFEILSRSSCVQ